MKAKNTPEDLTLEEAQALFDYDNKRGLLLSKVSGHQREVGDVLGSLQSNGTLGVSINGRLYGVHRVVWLLHTGKWPKSLLRHKNGKKFDNRPNNLAETTHYDNIDTKRINGIAGVGFVNKTKKWKATIHLKGNQKFLGEYVDKEEAVLARFAAEQCLSIVVSHEKSVRHWIKENL